MLGGASGQGGAFVQTDAFKNRKGDVEPQNAVQKLPGPMGFKERTERCTIKTTNNVAKGGS